MRRRAILPWTLPALAVAQVIACTHDWNGLKPSPNGGSGGAGTTTTTTTTTTTEVGGGGSGGAPPAPDGCGPLAPLPTPEAKVVYVASGAVGGDGSQGMPFGDLAGAVAALGGAGGTIRLKGGGDYPPQNVGDAVSSDAASPIRIRADDPASPPHLVGNPGMQAKHGILHFTNARHLVIDGLVLSNAPLIGADPTHAVAVTGEATDITLRGNTISSVTGTVLYGFGDRLHVEDNQIDEVGSGTSDACVGLVPRFSGTAVWGHDFAVRKNRITGCHSNGVGVYYAEGAVVEDNDIAQPDKDAAVVVDNSGHAPVLIRRNLLRADRPILLRTSGLLGALPTSGYTAADGVRIENNIMIYDRAGVTFFGDSGPPQEVETYHSLAVRHNTVISTTPLAPDGGAAASQALGFANATMPSGNVAANNVFISPTPSEIANDDVPTWMFAGNLWSPSKPFIANASTSDQGADLSAWGAPSTAAAVAALAPQAGTGVATTLSTDYFCKSRDLSKPARGAVEP